MSRRHRTEDDTRERFAKEIAEHELLVIRDDGLYRHIRAKKPNRGWDMHFDLITWPGYLCYTGDMGTFVFTRTADMFEFFRCPVDASIDYRYWAEKVEGADKHDGITEFDADEFRCAVKRQGAHILRSRRARKYLTKEERRELWDKLNDEVLGELDEHRSSVAFHKAYEFSYAKGSYFDPDRQTFCLELEEFPTCKRYSHRFLWCCHAIVWALAKYDEHKAELAKSQAKPDPEFMAHVTDAVGAVGKALINHPKEHVKAQMHKLASDLLKHFTLDYEVKSYDQDGANGSTAIVIDMTAKVGDGEPQRSIIQQGVMVLPAAEGSA